MKKLLLLALLALSLASCVEPVNPPYNPPGGNSGNTGNDDDNEKKEKPTAKFSFSKQNPLTVQFSNLSINATSYKWDFGDGEVSYEKNPTHKFSKGVYEVNLLAESSYGADFYSAIVTVHNPSKVYVSGYSYERLYLNNEYYRIKLTDDDIFTTTWFTTSWQLISSAILDKTYTFTTPIILDGMFEDDYYDATIYYSTSGSGNGVELNTGRFYTSKIEDTYPDKLSWTSSDPDKVNFTLYFKYE